MRFERSNAFVNILEIDPSLLEGLGDAPADAARARGHARLITAAPGLWRVSFPDPALGFLVLEGFLWRRVTLGDRASAELIGPGDVIRPLAVDADEYEMVPSQVSWTVLEQARLAELDGRLLSQMSEHPQVLANLVLRSVRRAQGLALRLALVQLRLSAALHFLLWHLADRFGHVQAEGVVLPISLTQSRLAELISAQRPSVARALKELQAAGLISRLPGSRWCLHGVAPTVPAAQGIVSGGTDQAA